MEEKHRKPDYYTTFPEDERTTNPEEYLEAWQAMAQPVAEALELVLYAFDPDFAFMTLDGRRNVSLPVWFVKRLVRILDGLPPVEPLTAKELAHQEWLKEMDEMTAKWREVEDWFGKR